MGTKPSTSSPNTTPHDSATQPVAPHVNDAAAETGVNVALLVGQLVAEPESRTLPSGSCAVSFSLTVRTPGTKTTSVPAVWYDPPKRVQRWASGDLVIAQGSVVRRFFQTATGLGSATEVVVQCGELIRHHGKAAALRQRTEDLVAPLHTGP